jgi:hypothetical protein
MQQQTRHELHHNRLLRGEEVEISSTPDPLEQCPYQVRFKAEPKCTLAKTVTEPEAELVKAALICMYNTIGAGAPALIHTDIKGKIESSVPRRS